MDLCIYYSHKPYLAGSHYLRYIQVDSHCTDHQSILGGKCMSLLHCALCIEHWDHKETGCKDLLLPPFV